MTGYGKFDDPYCYPGTALLRNLAGLRFADALEEFEVAAFTLRSRDKLPAGRFDPDHYRAIHPFREGNGRTQLTFLFLLGERARHPLDMTRIRPKEILAAMIASYDGKLAALEEEIGRLVV